MTNRSISLRDEPDAFRWSAAPRRWSPGPPLEVLTDPETDFWQRTHYGFRRDNGHLLSAPVRGDFTLLVAVDYAPNAQYDQCGAFIRADPDNWIKCSVEYETAELSHLGSVVTLGGFSDWGTQEIASSVREITYRVQRAGEDFLVEWSHDGAAWHQLRVCHFTDCPDELSVGFYACSPTGAGFICRARQIEILCS